MLLSNTTLVLICLSVCIIIFLLVFSDSDDASPLGDEDRERFVRWQNFRITQFGFAVNLFLTFAVAALGFSLAAVKDSSLLSFPGSGRLLRVAICCFGGSVLFGALTTISRLIDFRCTTIKIRKKYSDWRQRTAEFLARWLGGVSWAAFYVQVVLLAYGSWQLISAVLTAYDSKFR
jgi:hypothetical protein